MPLFILSNIENKKEIIHEYSLCEKPCEKDKIYRISCKDTKAGIITGSIYLIQYKKVVLLESHTMESNDKNNMKRFLLERILEIKKQQLPPTAKKEKK